MSEQQLMELNERLSDYIRSLARQNDSLPPTVPLDDERPVDGLDTVGPFETAIDVERADGQEAASTAGYISKKYNHRGEEWWNPFKTRNGTDRFDFAIPQGNVFSHYELRPINTTFPHELRVTHAPKPAATGRQRIDIDWSLQGGGQVAYEMRAVHHARGSQERLRVVVGTDGWDRLALDLVAQRRNFVLSIVGPDAGKIWNDFKRTLGLRETAPTLDARSGSEVAGADDALLVALLAGSLVAVGALAVIAYVLGEAIKHGCDAKSNFTKGEGALDTKLDFDIGCTSRNN